MRGGTKTNGNPLDGDIASARYREGGGAAVKGSAAQGCVGLKGNRCCDRPGVGRVSASRCKRSVYQRGITGYHGSCSFAYRAPWLGLSAGVCIRASARIVNVISCPGGVSSTGQTENHANRHKYRCYAN